MYVRDITIEDCGKLAEIHLNSFQGFFLTSLGHDFLKTFYYTVVSSNLHVGVCVCNGNKLVGFAIGTLHSNGFYRTILKKNKLLYLQLALKLLFKNTKAILRLTKKMNKKQTQQVHDDGNYAELLSICVDSSMKNKGLGSLLLKEFEKKIVVNHIKKLSLTTDALNNNTANSFYCKNGYELYYEFLSYPNRRMYRYIKEIK